MSSTYVTLQRLNMRSLGRYRIVRRIGRGGTGDVWLCRDPRLEREVAVKTLSLQHQPDQSFLKRFENEARVMSSLSHPHILQVHDTGKQTLSSGELLPYIVMPLITGGSLQERLKAGKIFPAEGAFTLLKQAAQAIDFAHEQHIIHRDIKPSNMLMRDERWLFLSDFGIARLLAANKPGTISGVGTPAYMAPEQAQGRAATTSDIYSLAVIVYQMFTGQLPFESSTALATMMQHVLEEPPSPSRLNVTLPVAFERILLQGLAKDPEARPALAVDLIEQLEAAYSDPERQYEGLRTLKEIPSLAFQDQFLDDKVLDRKLARFGRRQVLFGAAVTSAIVTGGALGGWGWLRHLSTLPRQVPPQPPLSARPNSSEPARLSLVLTGHNFAPDTMLWSPDSSSLTTASSNGQIFRWDIASLLRSPTRYDASPLYSQSLLFGNKGFLLALSPDGQKLAIGNYLNTSDSILLNLFTPRLKAVGQPLALHEEYLLYVGLTWISNNLLAVMRVSSKYSIQDGNQMADLSLLDTDAGQLHSLGTDETKVDYFQDNSLAYTAKGGRMAILRQQTVKVGTFQLSRNGQYWQPGTTFRLDENSDIASLYGTTWASDGESLVGYSNFTPGLYYFSTLEKTLKLRKVKMPSILRKSVVDDEVRSSCVACNPTSSMVAMGTSGGEIWFWNLQENSLPISEPLTSNTIGAREVHALSWSPDGRWLAASYSDVNASILIWKVRD